MADEGYVPTLGEYAAVIGWLWTNLNRHDRFAVEYEMPAHLRKALNDGLERASLRRVAHALADHLDGEDNHGD